MRVFLSAFISSLLLVEGLSATTRIMPLGDSITVGWNTSGDAVDGTGYRSKLWGILDSAGLDFTFVGSSTEVFQGNSAALDPSFPLAHEGQSGRRIAQLESGFAGWDAAANPDVILLMIGTNDMIRAAYRPDAETNYLSMVDHLLATTDAHIYVSAIPPVADEIAFGGITKPTDAEFASFNALIESYATTKAAEGASISFHDATVGLTAAAHFAHDGVHPNDAGYALIADGWASALLPSTAVNNPEPSTGLMAAIIAATLRRQLVLRRSDS